MSRKRRIGSVNVSFSNEEIIINPGTFLQIFRNTKLSCINDPGKKHKFDVW